MDVPPLLYNLVFGESVLNDAVAIVLFRTLVSSLPLLRCGKDTCHLHHAGVQGVHILWSCHEEVV